MKRRLAALSLALLTGCSLPLPSGVRTDAVVGSDWNNGMSSRRKDSISRSIISRQSVRRGSVRSTSRAPRKKRASTISRDTPSVSASGLVDTLSIAR